MWAKICGIQTMKAALAAQEAGADAVGFIFAPSRRQVTPDRVRQLCQGLSGEIARVGVFVDEEPATINQIARHAGLTHVQLHGDEPPEAIDAIELPVIKAFRIQGPADLPKLAAYRQATAFLLDPYVPGQHGGTGQTLADFSLVPQAAEVLRQAGIEQPRLVLAGGLHPQNVREAMTQAQPYGVDVSSGVETDGQKDIDKIYEFLSQVKGA